MQASGAIVKTLGLKPDVAAHPCSPAPGMWSREKKELKVSLSYIEHFRPAWATRDLISKQLRLARCSGAPL